jgi:antitoxin HicB
MKKQAKDELEEMFEEHGELAEVRALTRKKLLADALQKAMNAQKVTPAEMARRMRTSRPTVYRLLDPAERGATLDMLERASVALGLDLEIKLVPTARTPRRRRTSMRRAA